MPEGLILKAEQERLEQELSSGSSEGVLILLEEQVAMPESPKALEMEEARLEGEIKQLMQSVRQTSAPIAGNQDQSVDLACSSQPSHGASAQPSAVMEYQAFTKLHGMHGGWNSEDAAEFDKVLRACSGEYDLAVQICDERLFGSSHEAVLAHARWHARERELYAKQKVAIAAWRQERRIAAIEKAAAATAADDCVAPAVAQQLHEQQHRCQQQQMQKQAATRQAVAEWRQKRASDNADKRASQQGAQQAQREQAARLKGDQMAREARCAERAEQMKARKAEAAAEAADVRAAEVQPDPDAALNVQMRNLALMERRATLLASKEAAQKARQECIVRLHHQALERLPFEASTDAARVRQPTAAAWHRRVETSNEDRAARDSGFIRHLKPRATASWRRGLC
ncbi:hypothetical protein WJX73_006564 [Symbiochloris irregularis]|uniref:Uncharacterized protein n=1 Tax=Symbiochloris irregularis TaxID=706552 RepID=A0AAW1PUZ3_9CHLO